MSTLTVFIQVHGRPGIVEAAFSDSSTLGDLQDALAAAGVHFDSELFVFVDEAEPHQHGERHRLIDGLKHGSRIHVTPCKRIRTTVHFLNETAEHDFPPGTRVRTVKEWAVQAFKISPKDAAEHVLQVCNSTRRPASDTPLHELIEGHTCAISFDLIPERRVEG